MLSHHIRCYLCHQIILGFQANESLQTYLADVRGTFVRRAWRQWYGLQAKEILSPLLAQKFKRTFRLYAPYREECVFAETSFFPTRPFMYYKPSVKPVAADRRDFLSKPIKLPKVAQPSQTYRFTRYLETPIYDLAASSSRQIP